MKKNLAIALALSMMSFNTFASSEVHQHLEGLEVQATRAQVNFEKAIAKAQNSVLKLDLPKEYKQIAISGLNESRQGFLKTLDSECFVQAISFGAVGGSALYEDILNCKVEKIYAKTAEVKAMTKSMLNK